MSGLHPEGGSDAQAVRIPTSEILIRRIPAKPDGTVKDREGIGLTATSFSLKPRGNEYPSWSRKSITQPRELLAIEERKGHDVTGWHVCELSVSTVRELGLEVVSQPTEEDAGHCLIVPTERQGFKDAIWSKLSKQARVILTLHGPSER